MPGPEPAAGSIESRPFPASALPVASLLRSYRSGWRATRSGSIRNLARLRLGPTRHAPRPFLARASRAPSTCRSLVPSRRKPLSETWLNCEDRRGSRRLARLRLGPTRHAPRPFLARASRAPSTCRSLVPSRRKPLSETWLNCEDRRGSRRLVGRRDTRSRPGRKPRGSMPGRMASATESGPRVARSTPPRRDARTEPSANRAALRLRITAPSTGARGARSPRRRGRRSRRRGPAGSPPAA